MKKENIQLQHEEVKREKQLFPLCILANDINVPANIGSVFRIADALGIKKIYLSGSSPTPPNRKIKKTSRSTENAVAFEYQENALDIIEQLKSDDYLIVSLEITTDSTDIRKFKLNKSDKICLIIGAENMGIHQSLLDASDYTLHIPMFGQNSSMNVATACAIAVFELVKDFMD